jgi:hypothetical protein
MSKNRKRNGGMRRAYLKKTSYTRDTNPDSTMRAAIGLGRNINPIDALPHRARLWLDKNKHTPTMTEPMRERTESWHLHVKEDKKEWVQTCIDTPLCKIQMFFNGFNDRSIYYFTEMNNLTGVKRVSFTMSKDTAIRAKANGLKGIVWRT